MPIVGLPTIAVPQTVTLRCFAAARSIAAFRIPDVTSSFKFGRASNRPRGNGVRSRIAQMMSKPCSARAASSVEVRMFVKLVISTRSASTDQSARVSATFW
ncbi:MAG: hypothetical protein JWR73_3353 [Tardiphaga sp.]|nr:hypothetical protein [Tardiphaga sp.]